MGVAAAAARHRNRPAGAATERGTTRAAREKRRGERGDDGRVVELDEVDEEAVGAVGRRGERADFGAVATPQRGALIDAIGKLSMFSRIVPSEEEQRAGQQRVRKRE